MVFKSGQSGMSGRKHSQETKDKMSKTWLLKYTTQKSHRFGKNLSIEHKKRIGLSMIGKNKGKIFSLEHRKNLSLSQLGHVGYWKGKHLTNEAKSKLRVSVIEYLKTQGGIVPSIGSNEKQILDKLQNMIGFSIKRQFYVNGYYLDGYCQELNLAIEVDEESHYKTNEIIERDKLRQENIINTLNCSFLRIRENSVIDGNIILVENLEKLYNKKMVIGDEI